jgi:farnesyl diphosphate synthase/geranylgeranyl diphosphate synthase type II
MNFKSSFKGYAERVNKKLDGYLTAQGSLIESMRYSVLSGGKRFRPVLTYAVANAFSTDFNRVDSSACAVELIHAYSLIHDDLPAMDDDDIRHNQPACHKKFGEAQAILTGDGLQALAFEVLVNDHNLDPETRIKLLQELTRASFEMAEGQSIDLSVVSQAIDIETLKNMHRKKTGALLSCSIQLGALLSSKCGVDDVKILNEFSKDIGLAYQIQDDVLDVLTPQNVLGKKQNSDIDKNKPTYPLLLGLVESQKSFQELYNRAQEKLRDLSVNADELQALVAQLHTREF